MNGWDDAEFLLDPYTYVYYNATFACNGGESKNHPGEYSSVKNAEKSYTLLDETINERTRKQALGEDPAPFFFVSAPISTLTNMEFDLEKHKLTVTGPQYPERHANLFKDLKLPHNENFNPDSPSGASWVRGLSKLNKIMGEVLDEFYHAHRSLGS
ncbi:hypothetical protein NADFUDRAFT_83084 [Nadsonia fulvescens var. elongata DSM 6958]|uniref:Uncharacterized protein n=1 Tax=Nadsonia fulvescens var. elongata DSM 6958 TaxID=857566 RepID=A0A1E3PJC8_9ASCO|nr:hypothetical protein NADFUDRAFT_83084 [Nadsonia fulvescens var. elongata DSM 6958]